MDVGARTTHGRQPCPRPKHAAGRQPGRRIHACTLLGAPLWGWTAAVPTVAVTSACTAAAPSSCSCPCWPSCRSVYNCACSCSDARCTMHDARCMMHDARCTGTIPSHFATTLSISAGPSGCDVLAWEVDEVASPRMQHVAILASIYASNDGWLLHHLPASPCLLTCCSSGRAVLHALSSRS